jgi:DNA-binding response OmpR family regulator
MTILCVEDNVQVQAVNRLLLESKGFEVRLAMTLREAREAVSREMPGLIILDIHLPDGNGLDFLRELRKTSTVPVIALTSDNEEKDLVTGLESGCDDYVPKPYTFPVLHARIESLLRRAARVPETIVMGRLTLDVTAGVASLGGTDLLLTKKEFALLLTLFQNEGRYMSAENLYEKVWKAPMAGNSQAVKKTIGRLRAKIADSGHSIAWSRGEGYCLERV